MSVEPQINCSLEIDPELARWRRRALFLTSVFLHIFLIIFIIFAPDLLRRGKLMMGIPVTARPNQQITTLFLPPDLLKSLREPPPEARPSDKNRHAQGRSPIIDPEWPAHALFARQHAGARDRSWAPPPSPPPAAAPTPPPGRALSAAPEPASQTRAPD